MSAGFKLIVLYLEGLEPRFFCLVALISELRFYLAQKSDFDLRLMRTERLLAQEAAVLLIGEQQVGETDRLHVVLTAKRGRQPPVSCWTRLSFIFVYVIIYPYYMPLFRCLIFPPTLLEQRFSYEINRSPDNGINRCL